MDIPCLPTTALAAPQTPWRKQVAALCHRITRVGPEVLLITSRGTGRWIIPKGWPMNDRPDHAAALQEAWEEAGVSAASVQKDPIGQYNYQKAMKDGSLVAVKTDVFLTKVESTSSIFPEANQRRTTWVPPEEAARRVQEKQLQALFRQPTLFSDF